MPIIPNLAPVSGTLTPAAPSVAAATAQGRAVAAFGQSIGATGDDLMKIHDRLQKAGDIGTLNKARLAMQEASAGNAQFRAGNPLDDSKWEADMKDRVTKAKQAIMEEKNLSPEMRQRLDAEFNDWQSNATSGVSIDALKNRHARARTVTTQTVTSYRRARKFDDARKAVEEARGSIYSHGEADADLTDIDFDEQEQKKRDVANRYQFGIDEDPVQALEILSAKGEDGEFVNDREDLEEGTRFRLIKSAERGLAVKQADEFETIKAGIDAGRISAEEIARVPMFLDDAQKKSLQTYHRRHTPPTEAEDKEAWGTIQSIRDSYNAAKAGTLDEVAYRNAHRDARTKVLGTIPQGYNGPLLETLQRYSPARLYDTEAPAQGPTRADRRSDVHVEVRASLDAFEKSGLFGSFDDDTPPVERERIARKRRDTERTVMDWANAQEQMPRPEEARAYADKLLGTERVKTSATSLRQFVPGAATRLRPPAADPTRPALPTGDGQASGALLPPVQQLNEFLK